MEINLNQCIKSGSKVLSGRDVGVKWRKNCRLDDIDKNNEEIMIEIPDELYSINISFFLGMFGPSVRNLGIEGFKKKYIFKGDEFWQDSIEKYINRAIKVSDVLDG